jgi:hypothetical protein
VDPETKTLRHLCTGTLLSKRVVLTAAHCVYQSTVENTVVVLGRDSVLSPSIDQKYQIASFHHPGFQHRQFSAYRDIALLFLTKCVSSAIRFPTLSVPGQRVAQECSAVNTMGFGKHDQIPPHLFVTDGLLRSVSALQRFHSQAVCREAFVRYTTQTLYRSRPVTPQTRQLILDSVDENIGCYGGESKAVQRGYPCEGDSGGPVYDAVTGVLVGVSSFSSEVCGTLPNYFTKVSGFASWIFTEIQKHRSPVCESDNDLSYLDVGRRLGKHDVVEDTLDLLLKKLTKSVIGRCSPSFTALNAALHTSMVSSASVQEICLSFMTCIESSTSLSRVDITNAFLLAVPVDVESVDESHLEKLVMSRVLLCESEFEPFYDSWHDEQQITASYMDTSPAKDECRTITV